MNYILDLIKARPELAIIITGLSSVLLYQLKAVPGYLLELFLRFFTVNLEVDSDCEAYFVFEKWLNTQNFSQKSRNLLLSNNAIFGKDESFTFSNNKEINVTWRLTTGFGYYFFFYKKVFIFYRKTKREMEGNRGSAKKTMMGRLTALTRDKQVVVGLVEELAEYMSSPDGTPIYTYSGHWESFETRKVRPIESIFLKEGQMARIVGEIQSFYNNRAWYIKRGIPYRKGIMFSGPPGTGKTSTVVALAAYFGKKIFIVSVSAMLSDKELFEAICNTAPDCFIVIEDVDCISATKNRKDDYDQNQKQSILSGVTTQGLLNILDGITTPENRLFFTTTNHPEKLDLAFLRPGRVDIHEVLDKLGINEQKQMGEFFYGDKGFIGIDTPVSPAELQKAFMINKHDSGKAQLYVESSHNGKITSE